MFTQKRIQLFLLVGCVVMAIYIFASFDTSSGNIVYIKIPASQQGNNSQVYKEILKIHKIFGTPFLSGLNTGIIGIMKY